MNASSLDLQTIARALGGEVSGGQVLAPGPNHSRIDRSLTVKADTKAPDGFVVFSHAGDDPILCRDHVRDRLGMPKWEPGQGRHSSAGHDDIRILRPRPGLSDAPLPDWTPPDDEGRPKLSFIGKPEPMRFEDEARRHLYVRDGGTIRVKIKRAGRGFVNWYRVRRPGDGAIGWQARQPHDYVPTPYLPPGAPSPFDVETRGEALVWSEGEKDADALRRHGFHAFTFGGTSDVPDLGALLEGHHVVVAVDNDDAGRKSIDPKVQAAIKSGAASVRVVSFRCLPEGGDAADFFEGGGDAEGFLDQAERIAPATGGNRQDDAAPSILFYGDKPPEPPPWLIRGVLPQKQVAILAGQFSGGKTYVGGDLSYSVMTGEPFIDNEVERQGAVLWLAAEGAAELTIRMKAAALLRSNDAMAGKLPFATQAFEVPTLTDADALPKLLALVAETKAGLAERFPDTDLVMIVIDTLNSAAGFQDENSASETQRVFNVLRKLSDASGALVLVIDHYGKMTETGVRGSSAKSGAADAILAVLADKDETTGKIENRRLAVTKLRGAATGRIVPFSLKPVPVDEWGNTNCGVAWEVVTDPDAMKAGKAKPAWSGNGRVLKSALERALIDFGKPMRPFADGPEVKAVPLKHVRTEFYASYAADTVEAKKKVFRRQLDIALARQLVASREIGSADHLWFMKDEPEGREGHQGDDRDTP